MIGCDCETCRSPDPRDKRWRASVYIETDDGQALLVDAGPDIRAQSLAFSLRRVDAIIFTHGHADHIMRARLVVIQCPVRQRAQQSNCSRTVSLRMPQPSARICWMDFVSCNANMLKRFRD